MVIQHKCKNCGADLKFDAASGKILCPACGSSFFVDEMDNELDGYNPMDIPETATEPKSESDVDSEIDETGQMEYENNNAKYYTDEDNMHITNYLCRNCGANLIAGRNVTSTKCSFCDSPMVIGERLSGELQPSYVIPFKISKEEANKVFNEWKKKAVFAPKEFKKATRVKELVGQYVPFWMYNVNVSGEYEGIGTVVHRHYSGDYIITEKKFFKVYRKYSYDMRNLLADASKKMDDEVMDKLEPFDCAGLKDFNTPYLAGYLAEKYDYTDKDLFVRIKDRAQRYTRKCLKDTVSRYTTFNNTSFRAVVRPESTDYVLLPIWLFVCRCKDVDYMFTMNAQTGKVVGKPPISKGKAFAAFTSFTLIFTFIMRLIAFALGGDFLW